jgi:Chaperone of endosialidase
MNTLSRYPFVLITALVAMVGSAYGTQPPDVVNSDSYFNTAMGTNALFSLTPNKANLYGLYNTAAGASALQSNTTGSDNTASGSEALYSNMTGGGNTALGIQALYSNTTGGVNTASGAYALFYNTTGELNTAAGFNALYFNTTGNNNTASGSEALYSNTTGSNNTASGSVALALNTTGSNNTATGSSALQSNTTGYNNTASGMNALYSNTTGINNIAVGFQAGYNLTTGSNNIDIGNVGVAGESNTIRIGTKGTHKATVIAGIYGTSVSGAAVVVSATGRLGVTTSSERYKTAIAPMGSTAKLEQLRPVTFHLKTDPKGALQYGLIAEEVATVYPELVIRNEKGRIDGVRYDELAPMLLNEVQQQKQKNDAQAAQILDLTQQVEELKTLKQQVAVLSSALQKLQAKDELVAQR